MEPLNSTTKTINKIKVNNDGKSTSLRRRCRIRTSRSWYSKLERARENDIVNRLPASFFFCSPIGKRNAIYILYHFTSCYVCSLSRSMYILTLFLLLSLSTWASTSTTSTLQAFYCILFVLFLSPILVRSLVRCTLYYFCVTKNKTFFQNKNLFALFQIQKKERIYAKRTQTVTMPVQLISTRVRITMDVVLAKK